MNEKLLAWLDAFYKAEDFRWRLDQNELLARIQHRALDRTTHEWEQIPGTQLATNQRCRRCHMHTGHMRPCPYSEH